MKQWIYTICAFDTTGYDEGRRDPGLLQFFSFRVSAPSEDEAINQGGKIHWKATVLALKKQSTSDFIFNDYVEEV